jgi:hypothetical protein
MITKHGSIQELAALIGITTQAIGKLTKRGVLRRTGHGKYDLGASIVAYIKFREEFITERLSGGDASYAAGLRRRVVAQALKIETENRVRSGQLVETDNVANYGAGVFTLAKNAFVRIPSKLALQLARMRNPAECEALLRREIYGILRQMTEGMAKGDGMPPAWRAEYLKHVAEKSNGEAA